MEHNTFKISMQHITTQQSAPGKCCFRLYCGQIGL